MSLRYDCGEQKKLSENSRKMTKFEAQMIYRKSDAIFARAKKKSPIFSLFVCCVSMTHSESSYDTSNNNNNLADAHAQQQRTNVFDCVLKRSGKFHEFALRVSLSPMLIDFDRWADPGTTTTAKQMKKIAL